MNKAKTILGLSFFYHDSSATLLVNGKVIAAAQEERFTRKKFDSRFPISAIKYILEEGGLTMKDIDAIAFYENPNQKVNRLLHAFSSDFPKSLNTFSKVVESQLKKILVKGIIRKELKFKGDIFTPLHHEAHAASAFLASPFKSAAFLTIDGVGEWNSTTYGIGSGNKIKVLGEINFPDSFGLLYSAFTYYTGFRVNSGEYKMMGLAPYGEPKFVDLILDNIVDVKDDGSFRINTEFFNYTTGERMINEKFEKLFGMSARAPESEVTQFYMDVARSIQEVTEMVVVRMGKYIRTSTGMKNIVMAGGVALNCVANGKLLLSKTFDNVWIQPAAGDAGGSLGAALWLWHHHLGNMREISPNQFFSPYLGPEFESEDIEAYLQSKKIIYEKIDEPPRRVAELLVEGNVVGLFDGRMEFGPRALGARSILGHPGFPGMQENMNLKIKFRESFRPFAPAVMEDRSPEWFEGAKPSPYMLFTFPLRKEKRIKTEGNERGLEKLKQHRSAVQAITHVDYSARIQTVSRQSNANFYNIISEFEKLTGLPMVINTSFNVRGEPIVCTPEDSLKCFMNTNMDYLLLGNFLISKTKQTNTSGFERAAPLELD